MIQHKKTSLLREGLRPDRRSQTGWEQGYTLLYHKKQPLLS